jgi:hypothetical protein
MRRLAQWEAEPAMRENREPSLEEMLADPIVRALMEADGVDPEDMAALLNSAAGPRGDGARGFGRPGWIEA